MATYNYCSTHNNYSSQRSVAMMLAVVSALVLSPLYVRPTSKYDYHELKWSFRSGFVVPVVLVSLVFAIKTTSSSSSSLTRKSVTDDGGVSIMPSDPSWVLRIGSSSWGLASVLVLLLLVLSWQQSVQRFFWR